MGPIDPEAAIWEATRHWSRLPELADFAAHRHGFGDSDGGFGVIYPCDLDEYDRGVSGALIPDGFVQVYGFWGRPDGYEVVVAESLYLATLNGSPVGSGACGGRRGCYRWPSSNARCVVGHDRIERLEQAA